MRVLTLGSAAIVAGALVATTDIPRAPYFPPCSTDWAAYVDEHYFYVADADDHGPDLDSREWIGSVEEMAGLPVSQHLSNDKRCLIIQQQLEKHTWFINRLLGLVASV